MLKNNIQVYLALFVFGAWVLFMSWFILSNQSKQFSALEAQVEKVNANLDLVEVSFRELNEEIRQLHVVVNDNVRTNTYDQQDYSQHDYSQQAGEVINNSEQNATDDMDLEQNDNSQSYNKVTSTAVKAPTEKELANVSNIIDKLRDQDMNNYADFSSLMSSPETGELGPAALDEMMSEVSRMYESGEIDQSFFPAN